MDQNTYIHINNDKKYMAVTNHEQFNTNLKVTVIYPVIGTSSTRLVTRLKSSGFFMMSLPSSFKSILSSGSESLTSSFLGLLNKTAVDFIDRSIGWSCSIATPATAGECNTKSPPLRPCQVMPEDIGLMF